MAFTAITPAAVAVGAPLNNALMDLIRTNFDHFQALVTQDVRSTASPTFADLMLTGNIKMPGTVQTTYSNNYDYIGNQAYSVLLGKSTGTSLTLSSGMYYDGTSFIAAGTNVGISVDFIDRKTPGPVFSITRRTKTSGVYNDISAGNVLGQISSLLTSDIEGNLAVLGTISAPKGLVGRTDGATPTTGQIGEEIRQSAGQIVGGATSFNFSLGTAIPAGTWLMQIVADFQSGAAAGNFAMHSISSPNVSAQSRAEIWMVSTGTTRIQGTSEVFTFSNSTPITNLTGTCSNTTTASVNVVFAAIRIA